MNLIKEVALSFDDVDMIPKYSEVSSRSKVDLTMKLHTKGNITYLFKLPIISSPMQSVTEDEMAARICIAGGLGIIHRFCTIERQLEIVENTFKKISEYSGQPLCQNLIGASVGVNGDYIERAMALSKAGVAIICVDIAHGDSLLMKNALHELRKVLSPNVHIMAGNVATGSGFRNLADWGADSVRVGISSGAACSTAINTGHGLPTLQSIIDCSDYRFRDRNHDKVAIIADGGIRKPGDLCVIGSTKILTKNLLWKRADEITEGEELIAFEEYPEYGKTKHKNRKYLTTKVTDNNSFIKECIKIKTDRGDITVTPEHKWLCEPPRGHAFVWRETKELKAGDKIVYFGKPWDTDCSKEAGYLQGFLDGEGFCTSTVRKDVKSKVRIVGFSQVLGETADYASSLMKTYCDNVKIYIRIPKKPNHQTQLQCLTNKAYDAMKLLGTIRPHRLLKKAEILWENLHITKSDKATILSIENVGEQKVYTVNTESHTFIANGFLSHNCKSYAAGADFCMLGSLLAGTKASPGHIVKTEDGRWMKEYFGSASSKAQKLAGKTKIREEGVSALVSYTGKIENILEFMEDGIRSGCSYSGVEKLEDLKYHSTFRVITHAGFMQAIPHANVRI